MKTRNGFAQRWVAAIAVAVAVTVALLVGSGAAATATTGDRAVPAASAPTVYSITLGSGPLMLDAHETFPLPGYWAFTGVPERNNSQRWVLVPLDNGYHIIHQLSTGRVLDTGYRNQVITTLYQGKASQHWRVHHWGGGFVSFQQMGSGLYMQSIATSTMNVVTAEQWTGANNQVWRLT